MAVFKLHIDEIEESNFELIAIHSSLEDYRLAYFLNKDLPILLQKSTKAIKISEKDSIAIYEKFEYENTDLEVRWNLITNKYEAEPVLIDDSANLFSGTLNSGSTKSFLLPELKKVDYFLKIEDASVSAASIVTIINKIDLITTAYIVDYSKIKSQNNLIF